MSDRLNISVITACTGVKAPSDTPPLTMDDFARGREHLDGVHQKQRSALVPAEQLYRGQQHVRLMRGVDATRACGHHVAVTIVSAGYGLVAGEDMIAPYECTFQGMSAGQRRTWARHLSLAGKVSDALASEHDLTVVLMGDDYFDACGLGGPMDVGGPTVFLCGARTALRIKPSPTVRVVVLGERDTRRFACGLVGLKGEVASRLLSVAVTHGDVLSHLRGEDLIERLAAMPPSRQLTESA